MLLQLQVTNRFLLATFAYENGGLSVADDLVRLVGSGAKTLADSNCGSSGMSSR